MIKMTEWKTLSKDQKERALEIHRKSIVVDTSLTPKHGDSSFFDRAEKGGITACNSTMLTPWDDMSRAIEHIAQQYTWLGKYSERGVLVTSVNDIEKAKEEGRAGIIFGPQNADMIDDKLYLLEVFHRLGVRIIQPTYNNLNLIGAGCTEKKDPGISRYGETVLDEMNRLGILIDLSHCGVNTTDEAIELSRDPVAFTHTGPRNRFDHFRNKYDYQIKAVAEKGGVISITPFTPCIAREAGVPATFSDFLDCIDYVVNLVGVDHVGVGTDIEEDHEQIGRDIWRPDGRPPIILGMSSEKEARKIYMVGQPSGKLPDLQSIEYFPRVTMGLVTRGYTDKEITKILGGNYLELFHKVW
jgi:membrane dipeptidase